MICERCMHEEICVGADPTKKECECFVDRERCVVLPFKVGEHVYATFGDIVIKVRVAEVSIPYIEGVGWTANCFGGYSFDATAWGIDVFESEEVVQKVIKERYKKK